MAANERRFHTRSALLETGWADDVTLTIDSAGHIAAIETSVPGNGAIPVVGPVVPALVNLHSHAFQRAMAGLAEVAGAGPDSFWTWRERMYRCVNALTPDEIETVAAQLQIEMLKGGFAHVTEFHYQHHGPGGTPYDRRAETSLRLIEAAAQTGIGMTVLPVFYAHSDFGGCAPEEGQKAFLHDVDGFLALLKDLEPATAQAGQQLGLAFHSLRAATPEEMRAILAACPSVAAIHIHAAEQAREVEACLAWSGRRPVEWLLDEMGADSRWCLVHATQMTEAETRALARSGAVAGLCPMTEANLGDGTFPGMRYLAEGGAFGIGTDSHVSTSVAEELRMLEYSQRLLHRRRNCLAGTPGASVGRTLLEGALRGGMRAAGRAGPAGLAVGARADLVVLDDANPYVAAAERDALLDRWIFALGDQAIRHVMVAGDWVIENRRHAREEEISARFARVLQRLQ